MTRAKETKCLLLVFGMLIYYNVDRNHQSLLKFIQTRYNLICVCGIE